jgi:hypothetical protein
MLFDVYSAPPLAGPAAVSREDVLIAAGWPGASTLASFASTIGLCIFSELLSAIARDGTEFATCGDVLLASGFASALVTPTVASTIGLSVWLAAFSALALDWPAFATSGDVTIASGLAAALITPSFAPSEFAARGDMLAAPGTWLAGAPITPSFPSAAGPPILFEMFSVDDLAGPAAVSKREVSTKPRPPSPMALIVPAAAFDGCGLGGFTE